MESPIRRVFVGPEVKDVASCANFHEATCLHYALDLEVSFEAKTLTGTVRLDMLARSACTKVTLDAHRLEVKRVSVSSPDTASSGAVQAPFKVSRFADYGSTLSIELPREMAPETAFSLEISLQSGSAAAMEWLAPAQTAGKRLPYLYSQGQACLNRGVFPCQDTPAVKSTFEACLRVPTGFTAVMSGVPVDEPKVISAETKQFSFRQEIPIPIYLFAFAVGDLVSRPIGPRSRVWAEPNVVDAAQKEFDEVTESYIVAAEELFGPYVWKIYDLLVMPPSFPYGGMENPCLTFVTPTLIAGDRSLTDTVMHEIAHSWFGNLTTNANWSEFWLNEGFTMYAQRRIMTKVISYEYTCLETRTGQELLRQDVAAMGSGAPLTQLRVPIEAGVDPDDTYCETPYEKGEVKLHHKSYGPVSARRESKVGSVEKFDQFLKAYCQEFAYRSIVAEDFFGFFFSYFPELKELEHAPGGLDFKSWLYTPGMPPFAPDLSAGDCLTGPAEALAGHWLAGGVQSSVPHDLEHWGAYQKMHFLDCIFGHKSPVPSAILARLDAAYGFGQSSNAELRLRWSQISLKNNFEPGLSSVRDFLLSTGKQKFNLPLYRLVAQSSEADTRAFMKETFAQARPQLHENVAHRVDRIFSETAAAGSE